jgi:ubiquinone/menaquinone biosynthesis C-methylase UbiE
MEELEKKKIDSLWNKESYYQLIEDCQKTGGEEDMFIVDKIITMIHDYGLKKVVDIGCGEGSIIQYISEKAKGGEVIFHGVDVAELGVERARKKMIKNANFSVYDGAVIPFEDNYFDLAISTFVFEHLVKPEVIFKEMSRVVRTGGYIVIACPNYGSPFFRSPCNKSNKLFLLLIRLLGGLLPNILFRHSFRWRKVEPIVLSKEEHIMDYDTTTEPNLLFFRKFIRNNYKNYTIVEMNSFWDKYRYSGNNIFKRHFLNLVAFLGRNNFPFIRYYGPFFLVTLQKL